MDQQPQVPEQPSTTNISEPAPGPQPNPFDSQNKQSKKKKILLAILIPLIAALLVGGGVAGFFYLWPKDKAADTAQTDTHNDGHDEEEMVDLAEPLMKKIRDKVAADLKSEYPTYTDTLQSGSAPALLVDGYEYRYSGEFGYTSSYMVPTTGAGDNFDMEFSKAVNTIAIDLIKEEGLTLTNSNESEEEYKSDALICDVALESVPAYIRCANIWSYEMDIAETKPFAEAYFAANKDIEDKSLVVLRTPTIKESVNKGYKTATVSIGGYMSVGGAAGLFYNANNTWKYFVSTQGLLLCSDYDTDELKMAYQGETCYDNTTNEDSTVKP